MAEYPREEIESLVRAYNEARDRIDAGERRWESLTQFFTDDAVYIDPAWGRIKGIDAISEFLHDSMLGLEDWKFPYEWYLIDGDRAVIRFQNRLPGKRDDGSFYDVPGLQSLRYAGHGKFNLDEDFVNMAHMLEVIEESGWQPGEGFQRGMRRFQHHNPEVRRSSTE